jgi:hypothetical protein
MKLLRRINISAATTALICFFLPWVQVSCAGAKDTMSGFDLARDGHGLLWFAPLLMGGVVLLGLVKVWRERRGLFSIASAAGSLITLYLMNRERLREEDHADLISAQLTGWFWLGFFATGLVLVSALALLFGKQRPADT